ncbi:hypothetical protein TNCV_586081 [Trichonephila clavipes]|nr:hypothetical protein TNCV_586081 [Trichonephila clavipes]
MREISQKRDDETPNCYIPYHMVINEKSTTTKCRVVFNASSKTKNDEDEILRVGGRLTTLIRSKFPIIIPKHHPTTTLVIIQFHLRGIHSGTQMTLSLIRQHYWIPDGRSTVRREIKRCIECCKF